MKTVRFDSLLIGATFTHVQFGDSVFTKTSDTEAILDQHGTPLRYEPKLFQPVDVADDTELILPWVNEVCLCAALLMPDGFIIRGHRHDDCLMTAGGYKRYDKGHMHQATQGFLTTFGRFVDRREAMQLQRVAGTRRPDGDELRGDVLFSEDLY